MFPSRCIHTYCQNMHTHCANITMVINVLTKAHNKIHVSWIHELPQGFYTCSSRQVITWSASNFQSLQSHCPWHQNIPHTLEVHTLNYQFNQTILTEVYLEMVSFILPLLTQTKIFKSHLLTLAESPSQSSTVNFFVTHHPQLLLNGLNCPLIT